MSLSKENKVIIDGQTYYGGLNQPPKFVKVNVDCWEKIFDYLSFRDILAMSQTCLRMRQIGGYYFRENFHGTECWVVADTTSFIGQFEVERDDFLRFVDTVSIDCDFESLRYYSSMDLLGSLTSLKLHNVKLDANAAGNFERNLLKNIETVELYECDDLDGRLFASCTKLKCLKIYGMKSRQLLLYKYPMLEHFEYIHCDAPFLLFTSFLERNSNIKSLLIDNGYLSKIEPIKLQQTTVQLNYLAVRVDSDDIDAIEFANRLKALHAKGFYKKLHLSIRPVDNFDEAQLFINEMISFSALEVLETYDSYENYCHLTELKELHLHHKLDVGVDLKLIAMKLTKLERLWIRGTVDQLKPFLRYSKALKWVILDIYPGIKPLNLFDLNQMRQMGGSGRNVFIGMREEQYLATQWKLKNVKYDLVEIRRLATIKERFLDCFHDCKYMPHQ